MECLDEKAHYSEQEGAEHHQHHSPPFIITEGRVKVRTRIRVRGRVRARFRDKVIRNALTKRLIIQNKKELSTINIIPRRSSSTRG